MKSNIFIGIFLILFLMFLFSMKLYINSKNDFYNEKIKYIEFSEKINKIKSLQNFYNYNISPLKKFCKIKNEETYKLECNSLDKKNFKKVQKMLFSPHTKILKYKIELKKGLVFVKGELLK